MAAAVINEATLNSMLTQITQKIQEAEHNLSSDSMHAIFDNIK